MTRVSPTPDKYTLNFMLHTFLGGGLSRPCFRTYMLSVKSVVVVTVVFQVFIFNRKVILLLNGSAPQVFPRPGNCRNSRAARTWL